MCLVYNVFNAALLVSILKVANVIRGDGPGGFFEMVIKGVIAVTALLFIVVGLMACVVASRSRRKILLPAAICAFSTAVLMLLSAICVMDACSDGGGYCRDWHLMLVDR